MVRGSVHVRHLRPVALVGALVAALALIVGSGKDQYEVRLQLTSASGLRDGSEVRLGGLKVGKVTDLRIGQGDVVEADLEVDPDRLTLGVGASAEIRATNLLGEKFVYLDAGDRSRPQPSGVTIPVTRTRSSVELDEVLSVLDGSTRARLAVLINEAGFAMTGRRADFNALIRDIPPGMRAGTQLVDQLSQDNRRLSLLVQHASRFVRRVNDERQALGEVVETAGATLQTVSAKRAQLRRALESAPSTLRAGRGFLAELRVAAVPLGPAARHISASTEPLQATLAQLAPFRASAAPALRQAVRSAPVLDRLARQATPVLRRARPTMGSLTRLAEAAPPLTAGLDESIDNALGLIEGWSRAIQGRDGLGHVFRGRAIVGPEFIRNLAQRLPPLTNAPQVSGGRKPALAPPKRGRDEAKPALPAPKLPAIADPVLDAAGRLVDGIRKQPKKVVDALPLPLPKQSSDPDAAEALLDFLLG